MALSRFQARTLASTGFVLIGGLQPDCNTLGVVESLGKVDSVEGLSVIQTLIPRELDVAPPNTYSGNFGRSEFPLHTDLAHWSIPPRYLALRCIRGSSRIATRVLHARVLISRFGKDLLRMTLVQPRRPMRNGKQLLRLYEQLQNPPCEFIRWDSVYLRPATRQGESVLRAIVDLLSTEKPEEVALVDPGDILIVDNWKSLHGRSAVTKDAATRHIERVYLKELYDDDNRRS